jgi:putative Ca2+/H+ antiporter (TMEM165/GDT1 family)
MRNRRRSMTLGLVLAALAVVMALPVAWYLLSPLFITRAVDEPLPGAAATATEDMEAMPEATATLEPMIATNAAMLGPTADTATAAMAATDQAAAMQATQGMETALAMPTALVDEPMPTEMPAEPVVLATGSFYHVVHEGAGTATIYALPDGQRVLRLEDFTVLNGPDLHVYLVPISPVPYQVGVEIDGALDLGMLRGNVGSQNYPLGPEVDLSQFQSVVIWCQPFRVPFIAAALEP